MNPKMHIAFELLLDYHSRARSLPDTGRAAGTFPDLTDLQGDPSIAERGMINHDLFGEDTGHSSTWRG